MRPTSRPSFDGVLFFPVTPFTETGDIDVDALADHIANGIAAGPGGVFVACGIHEAPGAAVAPVGVAVTRLAHGAKDVFAFVATLPGTEAAANKRSEPAGNQAFLQQPVLRHDAHEPET